jgi:hypothetical protein
MMDSIGTVRGYAMCNTIASGEEERNAREEGLRFKAKFGFLVTKV